MSLAPSTNGELLYIYNAGNTIDIHDAGTFDEGAGAQPYFAMELVKGRPLMEHVRSGGPGTRDRLLLFVKICEAEACQAMGSRKLSTYATANLDGEDVTLEPVYCLGNCACSPAIMVDGKTYGRVSNERFDEIMASLGESG